MLQNYPFGMYFLYTLRLIKRYLFFLNGKACEVFSSTKQQFQVTVTTQGLFDRGFVTMTHDKRSVLCDNIVYS